jgi:hypothetical protein
MDARADLALWASDKSFVLPADGTRSMLFRFSGPSGVTLGAHAVDPAGVPFAPGTEHTGVQLQFWADEATSIVVTGAHFELWYGDEIGNGRITAVP